MDTNLFDNMDKSVWENMVWENMPWEDFSFDMDFSLEFDTDPWSDETTITDGNTTAEPDPRG